MDLSPSNGGVKGNGSMPVFCLYLGMIMSTAIFIIDWIDSKFLQSKQCPDPRVEERYVLRSSLISGEIEQQLCSRGGLAVLLPNQYDRYFARQNLNIIAPQKLICVRGHSSPLRVEDAIAVMEELHTMRQQSETAIKECKKLVDEQSELRILAEKSLEAESKLRKEAEDMVHIYEEEIKRVKERVVELEKEIQVLKSSEQRLQNELRALREANNEQSR